MTFKDDTINKSRKITFICVTILAISGCSKSGKTISIDKSDPNLAAINYNLEEYLFLSQYFEEPVHVEHFFHELTFKYYQNYSCIVVSSKSPSYWESSGSISNPLKGKEKSEAVLQKLCPAPKFELDGYKWQGKFNVFKTDGSVEQWMVNGEYYPDKKYNQIDKIEIKTLKPKGTFYFSPSASNKNQHKNIINESTNNSICICEYASNEVIEGIIPKKSVTILPVPAF